METRKNYRKQLLPFATAALAAIAPCTALFGAPDAGADEAITLPQFTINANAQSPYRAADTISAARIRGSILETPESISVVTREFMNDIAPVRLYDATRYVAGIAEGRGPTFSDRIIIRGFENDGRTVDNFALSSVSNIDEALIDRVEIVKGPNTILAPTGTPGGSVNVITKSPEFKRSTTVTGVVGLYDAGKVTIDSTGGLTENGPFAYRLIGVYQDTSRDWTDSHLRQKIIDPQITYKLSDRTQITLKYTYSDYYSWGDPRVLVDSSVVNNAEAIKAAGFQRDGLNGAEGWNGRNSYYNKGDLIVNTAITDHISMRLAADYLYDRDVSELASLALPATNNRYNPYTGILTPDQTWALDATSNTYVPTFSQYFNPTNVPRAVSQTSSWIQSAAVQNDFAANYKFDKVSSTTVAGWSLLHSSNATWSQNGTLPSINLFAPVYGARPFYTGAQATSTTAQNTQKQIYALERVGFFDDRIYVSGGASRVWVDNETSNRLTHAAAAVLDGQHDTFLGGILGKITPNVTGYYSFSTNANPVIANNLPLWQVGKQHEFGFKSEFFNQRLSVTIDHFQITQTNVSIPNPEFQLNKSAPQNILYDLGSHGYELEVAGSVTKNISVVGSWTTMDVKDKFNRRPRQIANDLASLLVNYHFTDGFAKGLALYIGGSYTGNAEGDAPPSATVLGVIAQPSFKVPSYTTFTAGASYVWNRYTFRLTGDNVFNQDYYYSSGARFALAEAPKVNLRFTASYKF